MKDLFLIICFFSIVNAHAQFAPAAGQSGSTAIYVYSGEFIDWAENVTVSASWQNALDTTLGLVSVGIGSSASGPAMQNGVVSLGDGGNAIATFPFPIRDGVGYDFAVFENSFLDNFLELAFVEVSSDGNNYFRFCSTSLTQDTVQIDTFGFVEPTQINNLAGKYRMGYGTPFDLSELSGIAGLDLNHITHIKVIDVLGSIDSIYGNVDCAGNKINDPFPTPFPSSGFDLDAIGVIHDQNPNPHPYTPIYEVDIDDFHLSSLGKDLYLNSSRDDFQIQIFSLDGKLLLDDKISLGYNSFEIQSQGLFILKLFNQNEIYTQRIFIY